MFCSSGTIASWMSVVALINFVEHPPREIDLVM